MATSLLCQLPKFATFGSFNSIAGALSMVQVRYKAKKGGGSSRNRRRNTPGKHRGWFQCPDDYVEAGTILYKQLGLKVYPGLNVGCKPDMTLIALEPGRVMVSCDTLSPYPSSPLYPAVSMGKVVRKRFYHVIPEKPQEPRFKLVSQI